MGYGSQRYRELRPCISMQVPSTPEAYAQAREAESRGHRAIVTAVTIVTAVGVWLRGAVPVVSAEKVNRTWLKKECKYMQGIEGYSHCKLPHRRRYRQGVTLHWLDMVN